MGELKAYTGFFFKFVSLTSGRRATSGTLFRLYLGRVSKTLWTWKFKFAQSKHAFRWHGFQRSTKTSHGIWISCDSTRYANCIWGWCAAHFPSPSGPHEIELFLNPFSHCTFVDFLVTEVFEGACGPPVAMFCGNGVLLFFLHREISGSLNAA